MTFLWQLSNKFLKLRLIRGEASNKKTINYEKNVISFYRFLH